MYLWMNSRKNVRSCFRENLWGNLHKKRMSGRLSIGYLKRAKNQWRNPTRAPEGMPGRALVEVPLGTSGSIPEGTSRGFPGVIPE